MVILHWPVFVTTLVMGMNSYASQLGQPFKAERGLYLRLLVLPLAGPLR